MTDHEKLLEEADAAVRVLRASVPMMNADEAETIRRLSAALREVMAERDSEKRRADGAEAALSLQTERVIRTEAKLEASWSSARERLLHGLYHIRDMECAEDPRRDDGAVPTPRREGSDRQPAVLHLRAVRERRRPC